MSNAEDKIVEFLKVLAHPIRLQIIEILKNDEKNVGDIQDDLGKSQSTTSQHLKILTDADLLKSRKDGLCSFYKIKNQEIHELILRIEKFISEQERENIKDLTTSTINDILS
ncbi:MAG: metalloregulator ArsR/SmtB family transcription factor [Candidatus Lokiarchaeota archaeon]|nr:metalloregulator ArsR/SmtB family transcription factor [Candidatus Lokiarchaeota archaeon]